MLHIENEYIREHLLDGAFGIEMESLRVVGDGMLSQTAHPFPGDAHIVRDFSENQTEINTGVNESIEAAIEELERHTRRIQEKLKTLPEPELLWPFSNPPYIGGETDVPIFLWRAAGSPAPKNTGTAFGDVKPGSFYEQAVAWAVENGITSGTGDGKFSPDATCTRAQSVTFLSRASGSPAVSDKAEFSDVSTTAFYADAVAWAAKKGITTGIGGGLFGSDNDCTRGQIVTFLWRCKK